MKILITGSTGFIGKHVLREIIKDNDVLALGRQDDIYDVEYKYVNLSSDWQSQVIAFNPKMVIHLAGYSTSLRDNDNALKLIDGNISYGVQLLEVLSSTDMKYFVHTGTFAEYKENSDGINNAYLYSATKTAFRSFVSYYESMLGFCAINVIPYTVYGGEYYSKKVMDYIIDSLDEEVGMTEGYQNLDFIHIDDVVRFYVELIKQCNCDNINGKQHIFHLGTGQSNTIRQVAEHVANISKQKTNIIWGARDYRETDIMHSTAQLDKNTIMTDYHTRVSLEEGITKLLKGYDYEK